MSGNHRKVFLGGPGTHLPFLLESILSWLLCFSCLGVSGYHYWKNTYLHPWLTAWRRKHPSKTQNADDELLPLQTCFIPLTTYSRSEVSRYTPLQRYHQLVHLVEVITKGKRMENISDSHFIEIFEAHPTLRRLATLTMMPYPTSTLTQQQHLESHPRSDASRADTTETITSTLCPDSLSYSHPTLKLKVDSKVTGTNTSTNLLVEYPNLPGLHKLARLWPQLLEIPSFSTSTHQEIPYKYDISCIIPTYCESGILLCKRLERALHVCKNPNSVEIIIVNAGGGTDDFDQRILHLQYLHNKKKKDNQYQRESENQWGHVSILPFTKKGGGRGPCLNYGASVAQGRIVTFCHSDTTLPSAWDVKICQALLPSPKSSSSLQDSSTDTRIQSNACAFSFGIDTSFEGLNGSYYPPGIKAVERTANIRTHLYSLPYGDQVISFTKIVFDYLGGFPDQCLMEDYEFVALLRKRALLLPKLGTHLQREKLCIIGGEPALCSPRRWQRFGVLYVTFMNSYLVNKYAGGMDPDELYRKYYGQDPPKRESPLSPWEIELKMTLGLQ